MLGYRVRPKLDAEQAHRSSRARRPTRSMCTQCCVRCAAARWGGPGRQRAVRRSAVARVDTLLRTAAGEPAALRLELASGARATLVADDEIFSNRVLRTSAGAPFVLRLVAGRYERCWWTSSITASVRRDGSTRRSSAGSSELPGGGRGCSWPPSDCWCCSHPARGSARCAGSSIAAAARRWSTCARSPPRWLRRAGMRSRSGCWCADSSGGSHAGARPPGRRPGPRDRLDPAAWLAATAPGSARRGARGAPIACSTSWGIRYRRRTCWRPPNSWRPYGAN